MLSTLQQIDKMRVADSELTNATCEVMPFSVCTLFACQKRDLAVSVSGTDSRDCIRERFLVVEVGTRENEKCRQSSSLSSLLDGHNSLWREILKRDRALSLREEESDLVSWLGLLLLSYFRCITLKANMATLNPGIGLKRYTNLLVVIKQTAFEEYSQVGWNGILDMS